VSEKILKMNAETLIRNAEWWHNDLERAKFVATVAHADQFRKWSNPEPLPYIVHPLSVMRSVMGHNKWFMCVHAGYDMQIAAVLHDTLEDTFITEDILSELFNIYVVEFVVGLTNVSKQTDKPRAERKQMDRDRISQCSDQIKLIKLYDRLDNLHDLYDAPTKFARLFIEESRQLIDVIGYVEPKLTEKLLVLCEDLDEYHST
jgi:(p)ppGpp synthase/HD superfamily hydrolase